MITVPAVLLLSLVGLIVYMYATQPQQQLAVPVVESPSKRQSINYDSWRGGMFIEDFASEDCHIPTLTAEKSFRNEYHNSAYKLGGADAYQQWTNNNLMAPNNLKAAQMKSVMGDWFDPEDKISPRCNARAA